MHLSSASALPMIRKAREEGVPLTIETTHHYLSLQAENVPDGATQFKCCPPVRDAKNQVSVNTLSDCIGSRELSSRKLREARVKTHVRVVSNTEKRWTDHNEVKIGCIIFARKTLQNNPTQAQLTKA